MSKGGSVGASVGDSVSVGPVVGTCSVDAGSVGSAVDGNVDNGWVGTGGEVDVCGSVSACSSVASEVGLVCRGSCVVGIFDSSV